MNKTISMRIRVSEQELDQCEKERNCYFGRNEKNGFRLLGKNVYDTGYKTPYPLIFSVKAVEIQELQSVKALLIIPLFGW